MPNKKSKCNDSTHASKIAALKYKLADKIQVIASLKAKPFPDIPTNPTGNLLKPPTGFTQLVS